MKNGRKKIMEIEGKGPFCYLYFVTSVRICSTGRKAHSYNDGRRRKKEKIKNLKRKRGNFLESLSEEQKEN